MQHPRMPSFDILEYGRYTTPSPRLVSGWTPDDGGVHLVVYDHDGADPLLDSACMGPHNWVQMAEDIEKHCEYRC